MTTELLFREDAYLKTAGARILAVDERGIELDRTIFYPLGGGQAGDTGALLRANGERIPITDTRKGEAIDSVQNAAAGISLIGDDVSWKRNAGLVASNDRWPE